MITLLSSAAAIALAVWFGWRSATRRCARLLRDHHDYYGADLIDPYGERP